MYVFEDLIRQVLCKFFLVNWKHTIATFRVRETLLQLLILEICYSHTSFNTLDPPAGYLSLWLFHMDRIAFLYIAHPIRSSAPLYVFDCPRVPPPVNWTAGCAAGRDPCRGLPLPRGPLPAAGPCGAFAWARSGVSTLWNLERRNTAKNKNRVSIILWLVRNIHPMAIWRLDYEVIVFYPIQRQINVLNRHYGRYWNDVNERKKNRVLKWAIFISELFV